MASRLFRPASTLLRPGAIIVSLILPCSASTAARSSPRSGASTLPATRLHPRVLLSPLSGKGRCLRLQNRPRRHPVHASDISTPTGAEGIADVVQQLRVPESWLVPSRARQESEWLRVVLHKWLDDEYCPEDMNVEISKLAAQSYYESLAAKETDLGEILLKMVRDLQSLSFQESFHGAFSSANAAVYLITQRMESSA